MAEEISKADRKAGEIFKLLENETIDSAGATLATVLAAILYVGSEKKLSNYRELANNVMESVKMAVKKAEELLLVESSRSSRPVLLTAVFPAGWSVREAMSRLEREYKSAKIEPKQLSSEWRDAVAEAIARIDQIGSLGSRGLVVFSGHVRVCKGREEVRTFDFVSSYTAKTMKLYRDSRFHFEVLAEGG